MTFLVNTSFRRARARRGPGLPRRARRAVGGRDDQRCPSPGAGAPRSAACRRPSRRRAAPRGAADEYLQRMRETGDPAYYTRAESLLRGVLARDPDNADALVALGGLALSRHDFRGGLALARRADAGLSALPVRGRRARRARTLRRGAARAAAAREPQAEPLHLRAGLVLARAPRRPAAGRRARWRWPPRPAGRRPRTRPPSTCCAATSRWCEGGRARRARRTHAPW